MLCQCYGRETSDAMLCKPNGLEIDPCNALVCTWYYQYRSSMLSPLEQIRWFKTIDDGGHITNLLTVPNATVCSQNFITEAFFGAFLHCRHWSRFDGSKRSTTNYWYLKQQQQHLLLLVFTIIILLVSSQARGM